jgi:hypothetical protein
MRRITFLVASMGLALVLASGVAFAHLPEPPEGRPFESDINEDRIINFCNPQQIKPALFEEAISDWNSSTNGALPRIVDVTDNADRFCELQPDLQGGDSASYRAQVTWNNHPDNLDISPRFNDLPENQKGATIRHELGHALGLDHNEMCSSSIMPTLRFCDRNNTPRLTTVGPHDVADINDYWNGANAIYPVRNKCWTNKDENGDGVCDDYGPPGRSATLRASSAAGLDGGTPEPAPPKVRN